MADNTDTQHVAPEVQGALNTAVEPDNESVSDDSGLGSEIASVAGSASLTSSIYGYTYENGRRYHAFRQGAYLMPNDAEEQDRLDLQHHIFGLSLDGSLHRAPLGPNVRRALDFGTGTGIWAMDFADQYTECEVVGTDLSPIQPSMAPPNCRFYVDDVESDWTWGPGERFDYIHGRTMVGSIASWPTLFSRAFNTLNPGGWVETQDYEARVHSQDDPELSKAPYIKQWQDLVNEAAMKFGKKLNCAGDMKTWMEEAGFVDVQEDVVIVPIGPWPKNKKLKHLGRYQREHMTMCVDAFTMAPLTRVLGWRVEEVQVLMAGVRRELNDPKLHMMTVFYYVYGRKPS